MFNLNISLVVTLQPLEKKVLAAFNTNLKIPWSKYDFDRYGIEGNIASSIHRLKAQGAIFEKITSAEMDNSGRLHKGIACYKLVGWIWI